MRSLLKETREKKGLTQQQFAALVGVRPSTVSEWETQDKTIRPCYIESIRAILDSQDPYLFDIDVPVGAWTFKDIIDMLRRHFIEKLGAIGLAPLFANMSLAIVTTPTVEPGEYLAQCRLAIDSAWDDLYSGNYPRVQRAVNAHAQTLGRFANTITPFQAQAASFAVEIKILRALLASSDMQFRERELYCIEAVQFGALSGDKNLLALAQFWHGDTYTYCYNRPQKAIPLLNDALKNVSGNSLVRSIVYSDLSIAHAQNHDEKNALDYLEMAHSTMPSHPVLDPLYESIHFGPSELDQHGGKTLLCLAEYLPDEYAKKAYDAFDASTRKQASGKGYQIQALTRKADASRLLREKDECVNLLTESFSLGPSAHRLTQISDVLTRVPSAWQTEPTVKKLQKDISHALIVAHR